MTNFGKYEIVEQIGQGGFGVVYKGWDPVLKRHVAIKTCTLDDADFRRRFVQEAEIAAGLQHPNIVTVHDFGEQSGEPYLVQEFLEGEDLDERIARGEPRELSTAIGYLEQVATGLAHAHEQGIVHRDVKPSNVRVGPDGRVSIMDFGIARLMGSESRLTKTGMSVGTAGYVSPEQLEGLDVDARADIFSFGVLAYELVARRRPFEADSISTIFYQIAHVEPEPLGAIWPACPAELSRIVHRCLEKDREARYSSFSRVLSELGEVSRALGRAGGHGVALGAPAAGSLLGDTPTRVARARGGDTDAVHPGRDGQGQDRDDADRDTRRDEGPRSRSTTRRAYLGLVAAAAAVALFGILNLVRTSRSSPLSTGSQDDQASSEQAPYEERSIVDSLPGQSDGRDPVGEVEGTPDDEAGEDLAAADPEEPGGSGDAGRGAGEREEAYAGGGASTGEAPSSGDATDSPGPPLSGILVLVYGEEPALYRAAENVLLTRLARAGYEVADEASAEMRAAAGSGGRSPADLGLASGAALVVVGELRSDAVSSVGGMFTGSAILTVRAYDVADGGLIVSDTYRVGSGDVPGELGATPTAARMEASSQVGEQAAVALRRALAERDR